VKKVSAVALQPALLFLPPGSYCVIVERMSYHRHNGVLAPAFLLLLVVWAGNSTYFPKAGICQNIEEF
jgi:hypothetical protein